MINVVNKYKHTPTKADIYIGRGSVLGNPFTSIQDRKTKAEYVCKDRNESVSKYKEWLKGQISTGNKTVIDELNRIWKQHKKGNVNLVCFCKPQLCHGDIIKEFIIETN